MLLSQAKMPFVGWLFEQEWIALGIAFAGLLFDLLVVPALLWRRTRVFAYVSCIIFHLMNSVIFNIHVFPWLMLAATPIFLPPSWPRRVLGGAALSLETMSSATDAVSTRRKLLIGFMGLYILFHCVWPLRHFAYPGDASWNERGHYFAWRMMLRGKPVVLGYAIKDLETGEVVDGGVERFINSEQQGRFGRDPEMILHSLIFSGKNTKA